MMAATHQEGALETVRGGSVEVAGRSESAHMRPESPPKAAGIVESRSILMPRGSKAPARE